MWIITLDANKIRQAQDSPVSLFNIGYRLWCFYPQFLQPHGILVGPLSLWFAEPGGIHQFVDIPRSMIPLHVNMGTIGHLEHFDQVACSLDGCALLLQYRRDAVDKLLLRLVFGIEKYYI